MLMTGGMILQGEIIADGKPPAFYRVLAQAEPWFSRLGMPFRLASEIGLLPFLAHAIDIQEAICFKGRCHAVS